MKDKFIYSYTYALLNLAGTVSIKQNNYQRAIEAFNKILQLVSNNNRFTKEIEQESLQLKEELHIIYFDRGNAWMVNNIGEECSKNFYKMLLGT